MMTHPLAREADVREAPRHEIAVGDVAGVPRALWGFACCATVEKIGSQRFPRLVCRESY